MPADLAMAAPVPKLRDIVGLYTVIGYPVLGTPL